MSREKRKIVAWIIIVFISVTEYLRVVRANLDGVGNWAWLFGVLGVLGFWYVVTWSLKQLND